MDNIRLKALELALENWQDETPERFVEIAKVFEAYFREPWPEEWMSFMCQEVESRKTKT